MNGDAGDIFAISAAARKIQAVFADIIRYGFSRRKDFSVGHVEKRMKDFANENDIDIADGDLYMGYNSIAHTTRESKKEKGLAVGEIELSSFPRTRKSMNLFYDTKMNNFVYVSELSKFIVHPNYKIKNRDSRRQYRVNFVTAQKLNKNEIFDSTRYKKI